jgi:hypothetical protein
VVKLNSLLIMRALGLFVRGLYPQVSMFAHQDEGKYGQQQEKGQSEVVGIAEFVGHPSAQAPGNNSGDSEKSRE